MQRSPTDCGGSLCVIYKPRECGGPGPLRGCFVKIMYIYIFFYYIYKTSLVTTIKHRAIGGSSSLNVYQYFFFFNILLTVSNYVSQ
jgi:hypothetical protein